MPTTRAELSEWFDHGIEHGATHMIVVADMFDGTDFPKYVMSGEDVHEAVDAEKVKAMQHVMEVYALHVNKETQLAEYRAFHYEGK